MEDVVLHYKSGLGQDLSALIETTEKLLAPFPCRPLQVFNPWFPSIVDRHLPLRPARPPPTILSAPDLTTAAAGPKGSPTQDHTGVAQGLHRDQDHNQNGPEGSPDCWSRSRGQTGPAPRRDPSENESELCHGVSEHDPHRTKTPSPDRGVPFVPETPPDPNIQEQGLQAPEPGLQIQEPCLHIQEPVLHVKEPGLRAPEPGLQIQEPGPQVRSRPVSTPASPSKRCWTVFMHRVQTKDQTRVQAPSCRFLQTVSKLRLQSRQRVKWVIDRTNCRDIEQVWGILSRPPLGLSLPSCCNAHIDRSLAQVWVYCDLLQAEQVGLTLKRELKLRGTILLWERRLGTFYTL